MIRHSLHVAAYSGHPALGLLHDAVEDGYLPRILCRWWSGLDAITRRPGETYAEYIERVAGHEAARAVKICDLRHNLSRGAGPSPSLRRRYERALALLAT